MNMKHLISLWILWVGLLQIYDRALLAAEAGYLFQNPSQAIAPVPQFQNGSFELPALPSGATQNLSPGAASLTGWTVGSVGLVALANGPRDIVIPVAGSQYLSFNGSNTPVGGWISQTFGTTIGKSCRVSFSVGRLGAASGTMRILADVKSSGGASIGSLTGTAPGTSGFGPPQTFAFIATSTSTTLTLIDTSSSTIAVDVLLDNVSVTEIVPSVPGLPILVSTLAGSGTAGFQDGIGRAAKFGGPNAGTVGPDRMIYIADAENNLLRRVHPVTGEVTTLAGAGSAGHADGSGRNALFNAPLGIAVDAAGNVFVADALNHRIRKISADAARTVTTVAGTGAAGLVDGIALQARFNFPNDLVIDAAGNLFVSEFLNHTIRKITPAGEVTTFAGSGLIGYSDGMGTSAGFSQPGGLAIDPQNNLYVAEWSASRIRKITPGRAVTTLAGTILPGYADGVGTNAQFNQPDGIVFDPRGHLYVSEHGNHTIRKVALDGTVTTVAGTSKAGFFDGDRSVAQFSGPGGLGLIVADTGNQSIRRIQFVKSPEPAVVPAVRKLGPGYSPEVRMLVTLEATPPAGASVYAIEDLPPPGWSVGNVSQNGSYDQAMGKIKFGPFFDATPRTLTYEATSLNWN
jgi:sugar lactone lactonase YvrE